MVTSIIRSPSVHRVELRRLLNKASGSLTSSEISGFLVQLPCMEPELLLESLCCHPQLREHELVMSTLREQVDAMSLRQLGVSLTLYPRLLEFEHVLQAFRANLDREVHAGWDAHGLARLFAENLGRDTYQSLVERAFPLHAVASDAQRAFRSVLYAVFLWHQPAAARSDAPKPADAATAAEAREVERGRREAELGQQIAALKARYYQELPTPDEVARLDAGSRAAWNDRVRTELGRFGLKVDCSACYYLRYPSRDALFDAETIARLQRHVIRDHLDGIIDTEDLRSFISRALVAEQVIERHDELFSVDRAPEWLDDALIQRARHQRREHELWSFVARFSDPTRADKRRRLLAVLVERAVEDEARGIHGMYSIAAELLSGNKTLWKSKGYGQALVLAALRRGGLFELKQLIHGRPGKFECLDDIEAALKPQVLAMHFAFGAALLSWARELAEAGNAKGVERALGALGVLDPPGHFTKDVRWFIGNVPLSSDARLLADHIHRIAASKGGSDATVHALVQCIDELRGSSELHEENIDGPPGPAATGP